MDTTSGQSAVINDNGSMTGPAGSPLRRILCAPFSRRTWAELAYAIVSVPLTVGSLVFTLATIINGPLWAASAPGVRRLGAAHRYFARTLLGEDVPPPPPPKQIPYVRLQTPDAARLAMTLSSAVLVTGSTPAVGSSSSSSGR